MDREQIFHWLQNKEFDKIISFLKTGKKTVAEDEILQNAVGLFFTDLINSSRTKVDELTHYVFNQLFILHTNKPAFFTFTTEQFESIILHLATNTNKQDEAFFYANYLKDNPTCSQIIETYLAEKPKEILHSQASKIQVQEIVSDNPNLTTSIFNSKQEKLFFFALRNCFPTHYIYPNISLSTFINSTVVDKILEGSEKKYFYNTTVDFVIIDQFNDFKPLFAIELDSEWHRLHNQGDKDIIKNKIFKAVGLTLYRIEHFSKYKTIEEFQQTIIETTKNSHQH
ncbi:MAG: DUF2726 domain-containing protein [Ferruginibacter sp.]